MNKQKCSFHIPYLLILTGALALFSCDKREPVIAESTDSYTESQANIKILVAYYTQTETTKKLAEAISDGVKSVDNTEVLLKMITEVQTEDLLNADGVIVGSPVYYGNMAYQIKQFFDKWSHEYGIYQGRKMANRAGAAFATGYWASGGKEMVINSINGAFLNAAMVVVSGLKGAGASATGEGKEAGRGKELLRHEYEDGYDLGQRTALVAAALRHGLRNKIEITNGSH